MFEQTGTDIEAFGALFAQASPAHLDVRLTTQHLQGCCGPYFLARCGINLTAQPAMTGYDCTFRADQPYH